MCRFDDPLAIAFSTVRWIRMDQVTRNSCTKIMLRETEIILFRLFFSFFFFGQKEFFLDEMILLGLT